ncbi:MAG TPA: 2-C-methyl-D-erythritol 2,4-cyclodiphosphate synthase [Candidatus Onthovivens sp.]|nr:2-C-methyl-D-erythritol 2,4-cyclodiphosphate synthase [Candidatus Onthovivens sp.]
MRIGIGKDIHKLKLAYPLVLGGIRIPYTKGLVSHSDGDVVIHSIVDAIFGALNIGDIGTHFPNIPQYRGVSSLIFLKEAAKQLILKKYEIENIDVFITCEEPRLAPYIPHMKQMIATNLDILIDQISIKAGTNEGVGSLGNLEAIEATSVCLLKEINHE